MNLSKELIDILSKKNKILSWLDNFETTLYYQSIDIRFSDYKIAPVDVNIFPAGFNNLSEEEILIAKKQHKEFIEKNFKGCKKILLITENHTRNTFYFDNVFALINIMSDYELDVCNFQTTKVEKHSSYNNNVITYKPFKVVDEYITDEQNNKYDVIILNNDLSKQPPDWFFTIKNNIVPSTKLGWFNRKKISFFNIYNNIINNLAKQFNICASVLRVESQECDNINFKNKVGFENIYNESAKLISLLEKSYKELNIPYDPYIFIKANKGTYGMGIMEIRNILELENINKNIRKKMNIIKDGVENDSVIIQEGIPTSLSYNGFPCEPMCYIMNGKVISVFSRINTANDYLGNLNSKGMFFSNVKYDDNILSLIEIISKITIKASHEESLID